ncbi:MAG TPA: hypothetical protein VNM47_16255 [Terriglobia bacterium]|nr:hypothetical protein [Terriglobia bacterium]
MKNSELSDHEFLAEFEAATLTDFHHVDHIRAAWIYLRQLPFPQASEHMVESLRHFAARNGAHQKYHETITQAWMLLVADALERDRKATGTFDAFAAAHTELLDAHALDRFYSSRLLASPTARARFVPPDLSPLPRAAHDPKY